MFSYVIVLFSILLFALLFWRLLQFFVTTIVAAASFCFDCFCIVDTTSLRSSVTVKYAMFLFQANGNVVPLFVVSFLFLVCFLCYLMLLLLLLFWVCLHCHTYCWLIVLVFVCFSIHFLLFCIYHLFRVYRLFFMCWNCWLFVHCLLVYCTVLWWLLAVCIVAVAVVFVVTGNLRFEHLLDDVRELKVNVRCFWNFQNESFLGLIKKIASRTLAIT